MAGPEENVLIRAGKCAITVLPKFGGKISSITVAGSELLQSPLMAYAPRNPTMSFSESDASGWDECLPSVADCRIDTLAGPIVIPDHGDLWRIPWQVLATSEDSATMRARCFSLPLEITRSLILSETTSGWEIQLLYSLTNLGAHRTPWAWSAHPLFAVQAGDRIIVPESISSFRVEGSADDRLGLAGSIVSWPIADLGRAAPDTPNLTEVDNSKVDLSVALEAHTKIGDKLFAGPVVEGWCALERLTLGLRLTVHFEPAFTPYLGLWICYGGWPDTPGLKQMCVAIEPATAPVDALAIAGPWSRSLDAGETCTWPMKLTIDRIAGSETNRSTETSKTSIEPL